MCFPGAVPLIGAGLSAAGAYAGQQNQNKQAKAAVRAREDATRDEIARQHQFEAEGVQQRDRALAAATAPAMPLAALQARRAAAMKVAATPPSGSEYSPAPGSAPRIVQTEVARKGAQATKRAGDQAAAAGRLGAYGDLTFNQGLDLTGAGRKLATTAGASQGSAALLPADVASGVANATRQSDGLNFADILGLTGQGLTLAGGLGATDNLFAPAMAAKAPGLGRMTGRI